MFFATQYSLKALYISFNHSVYILEMVFFLMLSSVINEGFASKVYLFTYFVLKSLETKSTAEVDAKGRWLCI